MANFGKSGVPADQSHGPARSSHQYLYPIEVLGEQKTHIWCHFQMYSQYSSSSMLNCLATHSIFELINFTYPQMPPLVKMGTQQVAHYPQMPPSMKEETILVAHYPQMPASSFLVILPRLRPDTSAEFYHDCIPVLKLTIFQQSVCCLSMRQNDQKCI